MKELCNFPNDVESERILSGLHWIGLFSSDEAPISGENLLDTVCAQLEKKLSYRPGERDLVMLQHKFVVEWENGRMVRCAYVRDQRILSSAGNLYIYSRALWRSTRLLRHGEICWCDVRNRSSIAPRWPQSIQYSGCSSTLQGRDVRSDERAVEAGRNRDGGAVSVKLSYSPKMSNS